MRFFIASFLLIVSLQISAQPTPDWDRSFGTEAWDQLHDVLPLSENRLLLSGNMGGWEHPSSDSLYGGTDYWVNCSNHLGQTLWKKIYGGNGDDRLWRTIALENGQFLLIGDSNSEPSGSKTAPHYGGSDYWVVLIDEQGALLWEKSYGSSGDESLFAAALHPDGGFLLAGFSDGPADGLKTTESYGEEDLWILHISPIGELLWQRQIGGDKLDNVHSIHPNSDGTFLLAGATASGKNHDITQIGYGEADFWLLKINAQGEVLWNKRYGGTQDEQIYTMKPLRDGHFLLGGSTKSQPFGKKQSSNYGGYDFWVVKVTPNGTLIWEKSYGGTGLDALYDIEQGEDGSLYLAGVSDSPKSGTKKAEALGGYDFWLIRTDESGEPKWDMNYGGDKNDAATQLVKFDDGALLLAGHSASDKSIDKTTSLIGGDDIWMFKTQCATDLELPNDRAYCKNTEQTIEAFSSCFDDCTIIWENGLSEGLSHTFIVSEASALHAQLFDKNGCTARDSMQIDILPSLNVDLGADTSAYESATVTLFTSAAPNSTWAWSTGAQTPYTQVTESGNYSVTITDDKGCTGSDDIEVCLCLREEIYVPNVFNPEQTDDYANERWYISAKAGIVRLLDFVEIYSVQGHLVHTEENVPLNSPMDGWDGRTQTGQKLPSGVYTYRLGLTYESGQKDTRFGTVTLVR